jgi:RHS repeat-associated protein
LIRCRVALWCLSVFALKAFGAEPIFWSVESNADPRPTFGLSSYAQAVARGLSYIVGSCGISEIRNEPYSAFWHIFGAGPGLVCPDFRVRGYCRNFDTPNPTTGTCPSYADRSSLDKDCGCDLGPLSGRECKCLGNPIYPATGNKHEREVDYHGSGTLPLRFVRYYNSAAERFGALGKNWLHEYERSIELESASGNAAFAFRHDGRTLVFTPVSGAWVADADVNVRLERVLDSGGVPTGWRYTSEADEIESYDATGRLLSIATRSGLALTFEYDAAGRLARAIDPFGRALSFAYDGTGRLVAMTDPAGGQYQFGYMVTSVLGSVAYPDTRIRTFLYEDTRFEFALTGVVDENGQRFSTSTYLDTRGAYWKLRALTSEHAGGANRISVTYNIQGATQQVTDALGNTRTITYSANLGISRPATAAEPCPGCPTPTRTETNAYDPVNNLTAHTDWNGNRTCFGYDTTRNLETVRGEGLTGACPAALSSWAPAGGTVERKIATEWHSFYRLPTRIAEPLRITTNVYGDPADPNPGNRGSLLSRTIQATTDATGAQGFSATPVGAPRVWAYTYDGNGQVLTADGPRGDAADVMTYSYYPNDDPDFGKRGNLATITNAVGHVTQISGYNAHGQPLTIVDPNGLTTSLTYDARRRLTSRTVGSETTSYEYDGVGQLTKVTLPDGSFLSYTYDAAHRLTAIQDSLGNRISYTLDLMGNRTREDVFDPASQLAQTRARVYSNLNRLVQEIGGTNPAAQITTYGHDNQGNVTSITDPLNRVTANAYDVLNRVKQVTDPANGVTGYGYDGLDQLVSVIDPRSNATTYTVDGLGNLAAQSSPDTGSTTNGHDDAGNVLTSTDAKGQTTSYTYDALNRVTRMVYNQATGTQLKQIDYAYDQGANGIGRLSSITEISAAGAVLQTTTYGYDPQGRVVSEIRVIGGQIYTTAYTYDTTGRMTGMAYPSGRAVNYGFDALGRINRIETTAAGETRVVVQDVTYRPFGAPKAFTFGNLQTYARGFDLDGRIATHTLAQQTKALEFDAASRITHIAQQGAPTSFADYGYDALDRLTSAVLPTSTFSFGYDPVGNRLSKGIGGATETYTYSPASNRLSTITGSSGARTYVHDANGSVTGDGLNTYGYDARGRLVSAVSAAGTIGYQVNALGQRVRKTSSFGDTVFHYDAQGRLIAESTAAGAPVREYLWLGDHPVAVAAAQRLGTACPTTPQLDTSNTFRAFSPREGLEAHSGRPGARGWEWRIGTNVRRPKSSDDADLDWVSGKSYEFRLTYDGVGNASVTVRDGETELFTLTQTGGMDVGNAVRFEVRSAAGLKAGNRVQASITMIDGQVVSETLQTAGDGTLFEIGKVFAGESLKNGFVVEGTVSLTFTGPYPPRGSRLRFLVTVGSVACQGPPPATEAKLYYVHVDHLNTPRAITDESQRVVWRWENTEPFGKSPPEEDPDGDGVPFEMPLRFPGQYFDAETGLFYNYFRDYDPAIGRYVQPDPLGVLTTRRPTPATGLNHIYGYVNQNPLRWSDPLGLVKWSGWGRSLALGPYGRDEYELESECKCGTKVRIKVTVNSGGLGKGGAATRDEAEFEDDFECPNPMALAGPALGFTATLAFRYGVSYSRLQLGRAVSRGTFSAVEGIGASIGPSFGSADVEVLSAEDCQCKK